MCTGTTVACSDAIYDFIISEAHTLVIYQITTKHLFEDVGFSENKIGTVEGDSWS